jgi:fatty-acid desaturase
MGWEWVTVHRKHHIFTDVKGDPHSPHIEGYWKIMIANVYYYRREANNDGTLQKLGRFAITRSAPRAHQDPRDGPRETVLEQLDRRIRSGSR